MYTPFELALLAVRFYYNKWQYAVWLLSQQNISSFLDFRRKFPNYWQV